MYGKKTLLKCNLKCDFCVKDFGVVKNFYTFALISEHRMMLELMKILIVEEDFISRKYLSDLLSFSGFECYTAHNAAEGLDLYSKVMPSVVVCSLTMHGISGLEFVKNLKQKYPFANVVFTASKSSENLVIQALRLGAVGYIKKPVQDSEILPLLESIDKRIIDLSNPKDNYGSLSSGNLTFVFNTEYGAPSRIVDRLMSELGDFFGEEDQLDIAVGLSELVTNAIEHGNLNISYQEKQKVAFDDRLDELYHNRLANNNLAKRKVTVKYEFSPQSCSWTIADEGDGFDCNAVPDPTLNENIGNFSGRGIFITRQFFDSLEYLGKGNVVKVVKKRKNVD